MRLPDKYPVSLVLYFFVFKLGARTRKTDGHADKSVMRLVGHPHSKV